jgi:Mg-chelatase subunit ChlD
MVVGEVRFLAGGLVDSQSINRSHARDLHGQQQGKEDLVSTNPLRQGTTNVAIQDESYTPQELVRLMRLGRELRLTDQILSIDLDTLSIVEDGPAPGWTTLDGDHVSFALSKMPFPKGASEVAVWLGTNAHELGHVLFSPRRYSPLMQRVIDGDGFMPGLAKLHNILEDQRQERLILGRFSPWRAYLIAALGHHIVVNDSSAWLLLCGRTWLPETIRVQAKARFVVAYNQTIADEVAVIVGEYQRLTDPGVVECDDAWDLLERLYNLLPAMPSLPSGGCTVMTGGTPDTGDVEGDAPPTADEAEGEGNGQGDGEDQESNGQDEGEAGKESSPDTGNDETSDGGGVGNTTAQPPLSTEDVRKTLQQAAGKQLEKDEATKQDMDGVLDALRNGRGAGDDIDGAAPMGKFEEVTGKARLLHHEVGDALLDLKDASEPGWNRRTDSGRLKVSRVLNPHIGPEGWFDRYQPGQMDSSELEMVLLLDVSGSMSGYTHSLSEATWAIRQSVDDLEGKCTVLTYCSGPHRVLSKPSDRPDGRMFSLTAWGGTDPKSALEEAYNILVESQMRNRLCVILTDGCWWEPSWTASNKRTPNQMIEAINQAGITTVIALLGGSTGDEQHGCQFAAKIDNPIELARLFRRVAAAKIGEW